MEVKLTAITSSLQKIFTEDQIKKLEFPDKKVAKWADSTLRQCITIYLICGCSAYKYMRDKGFPFVSVRTLQEHMAKISFEPGILDDMFQLMKYKIEDVPRQHRNFGLVMDEMSIQAKLDFDISTQSFIGRPTMPLNPKTIVKKKLKTSLLHLRGFLLKVTQSKHLFVLVDKNQSNLNEIQDISSIAMASFICDT